MTATDRNDMFMWDTDASLTLHQMRDFVLSAMTQPRLTVLVPRRNVKVPHTKSKKLQQLQSKPRDINASPFLLMLAPPSDCRYRYYVKTSRDKRCITQHRTPQTRPQRTNPQQAIIGPNQTWLNNQTLGNGQQVPGMDYYQQISTIAAMAWSDCSQATEKLRRIYEQTSILSRDPFALMYGSPYVPPNIVPTETKPNPEFAQVPRQPVSKRSHGNGVLKPRNREGYWEMPAVYCACAVCEMTKRTKSNMTPQRSNAEVSKVLMTQGDGKDSMEQLCTRQMAANPHRGKRGHSPDVSMMTQHPPRKLLKQENFPPAMQSYDQNQYLPHQAPDQLRTSDAILSYLKHNKQPSSSYQDIFLQPSLQIPTTSYMTSSNGDVINASDLMATPSFENRCFVHPQSHAGLFNGFSSYLPTQILNALE